MSIRIKLIITYAILVIISTIVLIVSGIAIFTHLISSTVNAVFVEDEAHVVVTNVIDLLAELKQADDFNSNDLISPDYIKEFTEDSAFFNGGVIVKYDSEVFNYSALPKQQSFYDRLIPTENIEEFGDEDAEAKHVIEIGNDRYFYIDYTFDVEGKDVVYYFIIDISNTEFVKSESGKQFFGIVLFILFIIMVPLILIITKDIIKPIKKLELGVKHIKNGDLDFKLETRRNNEIGEVIRYFDVMRQELKRSIEKQIEFEENRKELISSISHDLKTPITSIKGHVEGILDGVANSPEKLEKYLSVIYQKSRDMDQLIDDLFLFSKLDLNRLPFEKKIQSVQPFIDTIVNEMQLEWENTNHEIELHMHDVYEDEMVIQVDIQQIKRVFINIIQNAMKYMDKEDQKIDIHINGLQDSIQFVFSDNGQGIPEDHLEFIFDRFYRVDESRNLETGGTGLGLAISKQIIEQHHGNIYASSTVGVGTKIIVELERYKTEGNDEENIDN